MSPVTRHRFCRFCCCLLLLISLLQLAVPADTMPCPTCVIGQADDHHGVADENNPLPDPEEEYGLIQIYSLPLLHADRLVAALQKPIPPQSAQQPPVTPPE